MFMFSIKTKVFLYRKILEYVEMNGHPLIPPKPPDDDIGDRFDRARDIFSLSKEEYREKMEEWLKDLVKGVPAFQTVAEIVKSQYEEFKAYAITAGVIKSERHMIVELSSSLENLPVFVKPIYYDEFEEEYLYRIFVPATPEILDRYGRDPGKIDNIAKDTLDVIKYVFGNIDQEYRNNLKYIRLNLKDPHPKMVLFGRYGFWTEWIVSMKCLDDFWSRYIVDLVFAEKLPFYATGDREQTILLSDKPHVDQLEDVKNKMVEHAERIHSVGIIEEEIPLSYAWLVQHALLQDLKTEEEIRDHLKSKAPMLGSHIPQVIIADQKPELDNVQKILDQPTVIRYPFKYEDIKELSEECILKRGDV